MKQILLFLVALVTMSNICLAQKSLSEYSFVVVPDTFDFLSEDNQYQLNDMTKFFLDKNGFNAYYFNELPRVDNCDGLWADVESISGFTRTKIIVVLKDCKGNEVYRGEEGASKRKDYGKSYQDALRKSFYSFEALNVSQVAVVVRKDIPVKNSQEIIQVVEDNTKKNTATASLAPQNKFNSYAHNATSYLLKKINTGYVLYEVSGASGSDLVLKGAILQSENGYNGIVFETQYTCSFFGNKDLLLVSEEGISMRLLFQN
tara:strand:- start:8364 stop:9143 length:780 start_codon:yes stop_codon:yes gene_type:complete